ncbi:MAG: AlpA family transcriptional regulator [Bryobacterales bacterium]|nr:AlpA family transcriptional regulator [Bryobacterales bacterium]
MDTLEQLFASRVSAFLRRTGMSPTKFGRRVLDDPNLIRQFAQGRSPTLRTADRILHYISHYDADARGTWDPPWPPRNRTVWPRAKTIATRSRPMTEHERTANPPTRFLRLPEVQDRTGLSRSTIYVRLDQGLFPRPVSLGSRAVGWIETEVEAWMREQIAVSRGNAG